MGIASGIVGAFTTKSSADKASKASVESAKIGADAQMKAIEQQWEMYQQGREDFAPWREAGGRAVGDVERLLQEGPGKFDPSKDPGYEFGYKEFVEKPTLQLASATGKLRSSDTLKNLTRYAQDYASTKYDNFLSRYYQKLNPLLSVAGFGQTAAGGTVQAGQNAAANIGTATGNIGNIYAQNAINQGNIAAGATAAYGGIFQNMNQNAMDYAVLSQKKGGGWGGGGGSGAGSSYWNSYDGANAGM